MEFGLGVVLVIVGGAMEGLFSLPVTRTPKWQWENIWGAGSLVALVLVPWPVAFLTVPNLSAVYCDVEPEVLVITILFGLGWGIGGIFWGKAIAAVGMALGVSLLMGLTNVFGSPVPLAIKEPGKFLEPGGIALLVAVAVMAVGVIICAWAGRGKQRDLSTLAQPQKKRPAEKIHRIRHTVCRGAYLLYHLGHTFGNGQRWVYLRRTIGRSSRPPRSLGHG